MLLLVRELGDVSDVGDEHSAGPEGGGGCLNAFFFK